MSSIKYFLRTFLKPLFLLVRHILSLGINHKLLARQLRKRESDRAIHRVKSEEGTPLTSHRHINDMFRRFYDDLYNSKAHVQPEVADQFLDACDLPTLEQRDRDSLEKDITCEEIKKTINSQNNGKSPGPDGMCNEFYKKFSNMLAPILLRMYRKAYEVGMLPPTLNEATITVIPKKGKDLEQVGSYRPVSLLNTDQKIIAKTLSRRPCLYMAKLVHPDQTGFIPNRHSFNNLRRLFNIMYSTRQLEGDLFILSLDAEKAFDCVEWSHIKFLKN